MKTNLFPSDKKTILFDGVCNLCNQSIQFVIKRDRGDKFRFASLQSQLAQGFFSENQIDRNKMDSIILIDEQQRVYNKSTAALKIAKELKYYKWMGVFFILPRVFRDAVYKIIAKNRYKWFGKRDECMIPSKELLDKFLE